MLIQKDSVIAIKDHEISVYKGSLKNCNNVVDTMNLAFNNCTVDGKNMVINFKKALARKAKFQSLLEGTVYVLIPIVIAESVYIYIRK